MGVLAIGAGLLAFYALSIPIESLKEWLLPGNEELLRRKIESLGIREKAAKAGFLDQITAKELRKQVEEFEEGGIPQGATNNLLEALSMQSGRYGKAGADKFQKLPSDGSPAGPLPLGGSREDTEGVVRALESLKDKTKMADHIPAITRMTGPPGRG